MKLRKISWLQKAGITAAPTVFAITASLMAGVGVPSGAAAQDMNALLQRKYDLLQQQADTERMRAETERRQSEASIQRNREPRAYNTPGISQQYVIRSDVDPLSKANATSYVLDNGLVLRVSGRLLPSSSTVCVANCD